MMETKLIAELTLSNKEIKSFMKAHKEHSDWTKVPLDDKMNYWMEMYGIGFKENSWDTYWHEETR